MLEGRQQGRREEEKQRGRTGHTLLRSIAAASRATLHRLGCGRGWSSDPPCRSGMETRHHDNNEKEDEDEDNSYTSTFIGNNKSDGLRVQSCFYLIARPSILSFSGSVLPATRVG